MSQSLEQHIGEIVQAELDKVRAEHRVAIGYKVRRVFGEAGAFRVAVAPARPVARLAPVLKLLTEVEDRLEQRYEGLRLMLIPDLKNSRVERSGPSRARRADAKRKG